MPVWKEATRDEHLKSFRIVDGFTLNSPMSEQADAANVRRAAVLAIRRMVKAEMLIESYVTAAAVQGWEFPYPDPPAPAGGQ